MKKIILMLALFFVYANAADAFCYIYCGPSGHCWIVTVNESTGQATYTPCGGCMFGPWAERINCATVVNHDGSTDDHGNPIDHNATSTIMNNFTLNNVSNDVPQ